MIQPPMLRSRPPRPSLLVSRHDEVQQLVRNVDHLPDGEPLEVLADALVEKFGADSIDEIDAAWRRWAASLASRLTPGPPDSERA